METSETARVSAEALDADGSVLLHDEQAAALRDRLDYLAGQAEYSRLVGRAVADDEGATALGETVEDATQRGRIAVDPQ
jgi:hypothetical protein